MTGITVTRPTAKALGLRLPEHLGRLRWDAARIKQHQTEELRALLHHAKQHSPFHSKRLADIDVDDFELDDLPILPTMTKTEMMAAFDEVLTIPGSVATWSRRTSTPPEPTLPC